MRDRPTRRARVRVAAEYLGVKPRSLADRGFRARHKIPAFKVGRALVFDMAELDAWIKRRREQSHVA